MKLSEAIKLGSMLHPQGTGAYASEEHTFLMGQQVSTGIRTCAYGAALIAVGNSVEVCLSKSIEIQVDAPDEWDTVTERILVCPADGCGKVDRGDNLIFHLNDDHEWTREQIADWVEQKEAEAFAAAVLETVPEELVAA